MKAELQDKTDYLIIFLPGIITNFLVSTKKIFLNLHPDEILQFTAQICLINT